MKYLTKPVEVEAYQYDGDFGRLEEWLESNYQIDDLLIEDLGAFVQIEIGNYYDAIHLGDWVVLRDGEIDIMPLSFFHKTYQPA